MTPWWLSWWLPDDSLMTPWWLPDDSLMIPWWLPDGFLMTPWENLREFISIKESKTNDGFSTFEHTDMIWNASSGKGKTKQKQLIITNLILFSSVFSTEPLGLLSSGKFWRSSPPVWSVVRGVDSPSDLKFEMELLKIFVKIHMWQLYAAIIR